jgi:D-alanyl-D-alanine carboxypeptidase
MFSNPRKFLICKLSILMTFVILLHYSAISAGQRREFTLICVFTTLLPQFHLLARQTTASKHGVCLKNIIPYSSKIVATFRRFGIITLTTIEMHSDDEQQLITQAKSDPNAFATLYEKYYAAIFGYIYRRVLNRETAEDLTAIDGSFAFARLDRTPKEVVKPPLELPLNFAPGEKYEYSNTNYILLGMIIERASGRSYGNFLTERIFKPLEMTGTRMNNRREVMKNRVSGYNWRQNALYAGDYSSPTNSWSSGGIVSSVIDLAKWDLALKAGKLLRRETLREMERPAKLANGQEIKYGLGTEVLTDRGHRVGWHNGEIFGFNASFSRYIDDDLTVIILCNLGDVPCEDFARHIAGMYLGLPAEIYAQTGIEDKEPAVTSMVRCVILSAGEGKVDENLFTVEARNSLVPLIRRAAPELLAQMGTLKSFILLESRKEGDTTVRVYRSTFEKQTLIWTVRLAKDGKIAGIEPKPE